MDITKISYFSISAKQNKYGGIARHDSVSYNERTQNRHGKRYNEQNKRK